MLSLIVYITQRRTYSGFWSVYITQRRTYSGFWSFYITERRTYSGFWSEEFEDTKLIARIRKSKKNRQVPAPLVAPVVLI